MTRTLSTPTPSALRGAIRFTIRRPGCAAWATGVRADQLRAEWRRAEMRIPGHVVVVENGPLAGQSFRSPEAALNAVA